MTVAWGDFATPGGVWTGYPSASSTFPEYACLGPDGNVWSVAFGGSYVLRFDVTTHVVTKFDLSSVTDIATGDICTDGTYLWITSIGPSSPTLGQTNLVRVDTSGGITAFALTDVTGGGPNLVVYGPDGNFWATGRDVAATPYIAKITPAGVTTWYSIASLFIGGFSNFGGICTDGADIWVLATDGSGNTYVLKVTTGGVITATNLGTGLTELGLAAEGGYLWSYGPGGLLQFDTTALTYSLVNPAAWGLPVTPTSPSDPTTFATAAGHVYVPLANGGGPGPSWLGDVDVTNPSAATLIGGSSGFGTTGLAYQSIAVDGGVFVVTDNFNFWLFEPSSSPASPGWLLS